MKVITIGDLHGKTHWKNISYDEYDRVIFIGDYLDGDGSTDELENLQQIISFKKSYPEKVILLLGNHEIQYYWQPENKLKKHNRHLSKSFNSILKENENIFQVSFQLNDYLWTHAGITNRWLDFVENTVPGFKNSFASNPEETINALFHSDKCDLLFSIGKAKGGDSTGGPFRADISELRTGIPLNIKQLTGHYRIKGIEKVEINSNEIIFTDCLNSTIEWAVLDPFSRELTILR